MHTPALPWPTGITPDQVEVIVVTARVEYLDRRNATRYLGVSVTTLDRMLADGRLTPTYLGGRVLVRRAQLDQVGAQGAA